MKGKLPSHDFHCQYTHPNRFGVLRICPFRSIFADEANEHHQEHFDFGLEL